MARKGEVFPSRGFKDRGCHNWSFWGKHCDFGHQMNLIWCILDLHVLKSCNQSCILSNKIQPRLVHQQITQGMLHFTPMFQMPLVLWESMCPQRWWRVVQWCYTVRWIVTLPRGSLGCLEETSFCGTQHPTFPCPWMMWRQQRRESTPVSETMAMASWTPQCILQSNVSDSGILKDIKISDIKQYFCI